MNAVAVRDFDRARTRARQLDRLVRRETEKLPKLFGVPITVKESFDVAGLPTTWGVESFRNNIAKGDAVAVARLKQAGAVVLGKTNISAMLADWQTSNPLYGTTSNPWDLRRTPGGSSGGSAAAIAAGFSALETGSDLGGSVRTPAHYCGIYAHKPTWGICPLRGHSIRGDLTPLDIGVVGPMARSAADLALELKVMAGSDSHSGWQLRLPKPKLKGLRKLRVAIMPDHEICPVESQISGALRELGRHLEKAGATVSLVARPAFDAREAYENYLLLLHAALSTRMSPATLEGLRRSAATAPASRAPSIISARGATIDYLGWLRASEERSRMRALWVAFFKDYDVFICPVASTPAVTHELSDNMSTRSITVDDLEIGVADQLFWAGYSGNFLLPSTAAPLGFSNSGLPYGMQIIGAPYHDLTTIAVAGLLEKSWLGFKPPPAYVP